MSRPASAPLRANQYGEFGKCTLVRHARITIALLLLGASLLGAYLGVRAQDPRFPWPPRPVVPPPGSEVNRPAAIDGSGECPAPDAVTQPPITAPNSLVPANVEKVIPADSIVPIPLPIRRETPPPSLEDASRITVFKHKKSYSILPLPLTDGPAQSPACAALDVQAPSVRVTPRRERFTAQTMLCAALQAQHPSMLQAQPSTMTITTPPPMERPMAPSSVSAPPDVSPISVAMLAPMPSSIAEVPFSTALAVNSPVGIVLQRMETPVTLLPSSAPLPVNAPSEPVSPTVETHVAELPASAAQDVVPSTPPIPQPMEIPTTTSPRTAAGCTAGIRTSVAASGNCHCGSPAKRGTGCDCSPSGDAPHGNSHGAAHAKRGAGSQVVIRAGIADTGNSRHGIPANRGAGCDSRSPTRATARGNSRGDASAKHSAISQSANRTRVTG